MLRPVPLFPGRGCARRSADILRRSDFAGVEEVPEEFTDNQLRDAHNDIVRRLRPARVVASALAALAVLPLLGGLVVETHAKGSWPNTSNVVTSVSWEGGGGADTNAVRDVVNSSFAGGTNGVNAAVAAVGSMSNSWNAVVLKRDKDDLRVYRKVKDIWTWRDWPNDWATTNAPSDFLEVANSPGTVPLEYRTGAWMYASQYWPNGNLKYDSSMPPGSASSGDDLVINFRFVARAEDGVTELFRFGAMATRTNATSEVVVDWERSGPAHSATVRVATTDLVDYRVRDGIGSATNGLLKVETDPVWNSEKSGYQTTIGDLDDIRAGAELGATALQEHQSLGPATNYTDSVTNSLRLCDGAARPLPRYLHALDFADSYPDAAAEYYRSRGNGKTDGGCSAVRSGGFLYRNFDFPFDDRAEFVVRMSAGHNRFASVGVAQVGTNLTEEIVTSGKPSRCYKWLPGATVDGVNENGVVCEINVVDTPVTGWHTTGDLHPLAAVRWVLDNATNAQGAAEYVAANIRFPQGWVQNFHYMIADAISTYVVENGTATNGDEYHEPDEPVAMTNFQLSKFPWDGMGMERFGLLLGGANITNAWYTRAYHRETTPPWVSDLKDVLAYTNDIFNAWAAHPKEYFRSQLNGGQPWWQTVHTSIYDITNRVLRVAVQEVDDWYTFAVQSGGAVKSVNGKTGEVVLDAADVGAMPDTFEETDPTATAKANAAIAAAGCVMTSEYGQISTPYGIIVDSQTEFNKHGVFDFYSFTQYYFPFDDGWGSNPNHDFATVDLVDTARDLAVAAHAHSEATRAMIDATNPTFSNAVLAAGLNIDTNSVTVLNEIAATFGDFPITGTATTVGGLLAALAAAVAWLRKNKIDKLKVTGMTAEATAENGVAKLDEFFKEYNPLLVGTIKANAGGEDEKTQTVFDELARMDAFTSTSTESDSFDIAITKLSQLLGENVAA